MNDPDPVGGKPWEWWTPGQPERGLQGFATKADRDGFFAGDDGPFRRTKSGQGEPVYPQMPMRKLRGQGE